MIYYVRYVTCNISWKKRIYIMINVIHAKPTALNDWAYESIKNEILNLTYPPGAQLPVEILAERMAISRTPIREALLRLQSDGLVQSVARVGFFVTEITEKDLSELFELRTLLECHAAAKAAPRLTDADIKEVDRLAAQSLAAVDKGDMASFLDVDTRLHSLLIERSENSRLIAMMETIRDLTYRERGLSIRSPDTVRETLKEHQRLAEALRQHDGELASQRMGEHLDAVRQRVLAVIQSKPA
jgi:DNA-binding GntR family transcriptional regulator